MGYTWGPDRTTTPSSLGRRREVAQALARYEWGAGSQMGPCLRSLVDSLAEDFGSVE